MSKCRERMSTLTELYSALRSTARRFYGAERMLEIHHLSYIHASPPPTVVGPWYECMWRHCRLLSRQMSSGWRPASGGVCREAMPVSHRVYLGHCALSLCCGLTAHLTSTMGREWRRAGSATTECSGGSKQPQGRTDDTAGRLDDSER